MGRGLTQRGGVVGQSGAGGMEGEMPLFKKPAPEKEAV